MSSARRVLSSRPPTQDGSTARRQSAPYQPRRRAVSDDEDNENEMDIDELALPLPKPQIDAGFRKQPLEKSAALAKLNSLMKEWTLVAKQIQDSMNLLSDATGEYAEALSAADTELDVLENKDVIAADIHYRQLLDRFCEANARKTVLESLRHRVQGGEAVTDGLSSYEKDTKMELDAYDSRTARKKYVNLESYISFRTQIWEASHEGHGLPSMKTFVNREDGDSESDDEDIEMQAGTYNMKDPITLGWLEKPVKTDACKHSFSRDSITSLIKGTTSRTQVQCPVAGCSKIIKLSALQDDEQLERRVQGRIRREKERGGQQAGAYTQIDDEE